MNDNNLHKELYQLMTGSISMRLLNAEERERVENNILSLEASDMKKVIKRFEKEKEEVSKVLISKKKELEQVEVLETAMNDAKDAARELDREYLSMQSKDERDESSRSADRLLDELDRIN